MKKNYLTGFIGALTGGIIFSLPWVLVYIYGRMMFSLLGALIGFGAYLFYKLFNGKIGKPTKWIIILCFLVSITIATFLIIPLMLSLRDIGSFSFDYVDYLYSHDGFVSAILSDYFISVVFTLLGITGIITTVKVDTSNELGEELIDTSNLTFEEKVKLVEDVYSKYDAFSKEKRVSEFKIMKELNIINKLAFFIEMEKEGVIVCPFIKSYMNKDVLNDREGAKKYYRKNVVLGIVIGIIVGLVGVAVGLLLS